MDQSIHRRSLSVPEGSQAEWDFVEDPVEGGNQQESGPRRPGVVFKTPDPRSLFIGNQRLDRYLRNIGQDEVLALSELLAALECWSEFESAYRPGGRAPFHPRLLVGLILLGLLSGQTSLRQLEQMARIDVRAWWLLGGLCPDFTTISKFITRHNELLTGAFFEEITRMVLQRTGSQASALAGDGTVIQAAASSLKLLKQEAAEQAAAEAEKQASAEPDNEQAQRQATLAREVSETCRQRTEQRKYKGRSNPDAPVSPTEPEAVVQPLKNKANRASYKPSVVSNSDRIITGLAVDPSNEPQMVESMIDQTERITGGEVTEVQLDSGYFCATILQLCYARDINLLCAPKKTESKSSAKNQATKRFGKYDFVYDEEHNEYRCPAGHALRPSRTWKGNKKQSARILYSGAPCANCAQRSRCVRGKGNRTITRPEHEELSEAQRAVMKQKAARRRYRKRQGMVEPVFGELRYIQHLVRFRRRGLNAVKLEFALHCSAHNLRRYLHISRRKRLHTLHAPRAPHRPLEAVWLRVVVIWWPYHAR